MIATRMIPLFLYWSISGLVAPCLYGQELWTGPSTRFTKLNYADWTLEGNQDRITDSVWLTRADNKGLFNIAREDEYNKTDNDSPAGTEWANGSISDGVENLSFSTWVNSYANGPDEVGIPKVLHIIDEDIYVDVVFTEWTGGGGGSGQGFGGGFVYIRSTRETTTSSTSQAEVTNRVFPNPTRNSLQVSGLTRAASFAITDVSGTLVAQGEVSPEQAITVGHLPPGIYILSVPETKTFRFVKL